MRDLLGNDRKLMVDANQSWTIEQAKHMVGQIEPYNVTWLEEPIAADRPHEEWYDLNGSSTISLAGGENIFSENGFSKLVSKDYLDVVQPDLAKWGGLTKTVPIARSIIAAKKSYCRLPMHWQRLVATAFLRWTATQIHCEHLLVRNF